MRHYVCSFYLTSKFPFDDAAWYLAVLGSVIKPLVQELEIPRYWFCPYSSPTSKMVSPNGEEVPWHVKLRYDCDEEKTNELKDWLELFTEHLPLTYEIVECSVAEDLGGARYLNEVETESTPQQRANVVFNYLHGLSQAMLDCVMSDPVQEGRFVLEMNQQASNQCTTQVFESLYHLFWAITQWDAPLAVIEVNGLVSLGAPAQVVNLITSGRAQIRGLVTHPF